MLSVGWIGGVQPFAATHNFVKVLVIPRPVVPMNNGVITTLVHLYCIAIDYQGASFLPENSYNSNFILSQTSLSLTKSIEKISTSTTPN